MMSQQAISSAEKQPMPETSGRWVEAGGIAAAEEDLDVVRIVADEVALGHVLDHPGRDMRAEKVAL